MVQVSHLIIRFFFFFILCCEQLLLLVVAVHGLSLVLVVCLQVVTEGKGKSKGHKCIFRWLAKELLLSVWAISQARTAFFPSRIVYTTTTRSTGEGRGSAVWMDARERVRSYVCVPVRSE